MTKMKSKKMTKSTFAIIIMGIIMVAMLAFGGTFAYFTATGANVADVDPVTAGTLALTVGDDQTITKVFQGNYAVPGDTLWTVDITPDNGDTNVKTYVFASWTITNAGNVVLTTDGPSSTDWKLINGSTTVYYAVVNASAEVPAFTDTVVFDAEENGNEAQTKEISCALTFSSIQYDHVGNEVKDQYTEAHRAADAYALLATLNNGKVPSGT